MSAKTPLYPNQAQSPVDPLVIPTTGPGADRIQISLRFVTVSSVAVPAGSVSASIELISVDAFI